MTRAWMVPLLLAAMSVRADVPLREKIGQMVMVTVTGDSLEETGPSMDTLKSDLANRFVGGLVMFTWSGNLTAPAQITRFCAQLQARAHVPLLLAIDQEGGRVARLGASNGFASTSTAYDLGTVIDQESATRATAATMAGWFQQTGLTLNLAPVVDVNVNPASPAIGALKRSFSGDAAAVARHAGWFIEEFRRKGIGTVVKHFPGHGSAAADSHLGFTDITATWSAAELDPYRILFEGGLVDAVMTGHLFHADIDSVFPATLSHAAVSDLLRGALGWQGVVISDEMSMKAITSQFGLEEAMVRAVNAGVDILLYNRNLDSAGGSLARRIVRVLEDRVQDGTIPLSRIDEAYARIMDLKAHRVTGLAIAQSGVEPDGLHLENFPNPFNPVTTIQYHVPVDGPVVLRLYDMLGREVVTLVDADQRRGAYALRFDGSQYASGIYLARLETPRGTATRRLLLVR